MRAWAPSPVGGEFSPVAELGKRERRRGLSRRQPVAAGLRWALARRGNSGDSCQSPVQRIFTARFAPGHVLELLLRAAAPAPPPPRSRTFLAAPLPAARGRPLSLSFRCGCFALLTAALCSFKMEKQQLARPAARAAGMLAPRRARDAGPPATSAPELAPSLRRRGRTGPSVAEKGRPGPFSLPAPAGRLRATCSAKPLVKLYGGHGHFTFACSS